ncbi:IpaD/SipD/SspD family type III secretion system needle tip protein [Salmonella enterica]|nr:IpaD/SipD/SspD family type III secretion system needle tip protein [Salmonella enterica]EKS5988196.1 IpaD/SipD/SspD family type III secretion system needle tip protein [Salmonella enterica]
MNIMLDAQKCFSESAIKRNGAGTPNVNEEKVSGDRLKDLLSLLSMPESCHDLNWLKLVRQYVNEFGDNVEGFCVGTQEGNNSVFNHSPLMAKQRTPFDINSSIRKIRGQLIKDKYASELSYKKLLKNVSGDSTSYKSFWEIIASAISTIQRNYLNVYAELMEDYVDMYQYYNDIVGKAASQAVEEGGDANHIKFNTDAMNSAYQSFQSKLRNPGYVIPNWGSLTSSQRNDITKTLSPAFTVSSSGEVSFDLSSYWNLPHSPAGISKGTVSLPSYQAWLAQFNSVGNTLQSNMQSFAQTYSQVNNTFNNLNKILSGSITSLGESANFVIKSIS